MNKKYFTEEERKKGKEKKQTDWRNTPYGRATYLLTNYKKMDKMNGFNENLCDLTPQWIVENIFSKPCAHCSKTGWEVIGCNRIDNEKPHTIDNVEPCCMNCNVELIRPKKPLAKINPATKEIVEIYDSYMDARRDGYTHCDSVAKGIRKQDKGYIFIYL